MFRKKCFRARNNSVIPWIISCCFYAVAAPAQEAAFSEHEKLIKEGQDRLQHQTSELLKRPDVFLQQQSDDPQSAQTEDGGPCFDIHNIQIDGVTLLEDEALQPVVEPYKGQCLSLNDINGLVAKLSEMYLQDGYVTSRAYIKPQDLSDGSLEVLVLEGKVEALQSADKSIDTLQLELAFPLEPGQVLNLRRIEQGIENLNGISRNRAKAELEPGAQQGTSVVVINNQPSKAWAGSIGLNNTGVESTGEAQLDTSLVYGGLLGLNDALVFSGSSNVGQHDLPTSVSRSYSLNASIPYGYWYFSVGNNYYHYKRTVLGNTVNFLTRGSSFNTSLSASRVLYRGTDDKLSMSLALNRKESRNYIEDVFLDTSSRVLYVWDLNTSYLRHFSFGSVTTSFKVSKSVPWFDAKRELAEAEDDFQFTKYQWDLSLNSQFDFFGKPLIYRLSAHALYSPKVILASEGITVGGRYSVRGFSQQSMFGFRGGYIRNDLSLPFNPYLPFVNQAQLYMGLDVGASNLPEFPGQNKNWVAGGIAGLRLSGQMFELDFSYARTLRTPDFLPSSQQELDVSIRLRF